MGFARTTPQTIHLPLATYHLPLATYHLPLATSRVPLTTYHSALTDYQVLSVRDQSDTSKQLFTRKQGAFFSQHMSEGRIHLVGQTEGRVLIADGDGIDEFHATLSPQTREGYNTIVSTNIMMKLGSVHFIKKAAINQTALFKLSELCSYVALNAKEVVFEQGDPADSFYIILKGVRVRVRVRTPSVSVHM